MQINQRKLLIVSGVFLLFILIGWFIFAVTHQNGIQETGGSGVPDKGSVTVYGWQASSSDNIPVTRFFSLKGQQFLTKYLEALLSQQDQKHPTYTARIKEGSVEIDYEKNIIRFHITIDENKQEYSVEYFPTTENIKIYDKAGIYILPGDIVP